MLKNIAEWLTARQELSYLKNRVSAMETELSRLEDENRSLWLMLDEIKEQETAVAARFQEELTNELLRSIEPIAKA